MSPEDVYNKYKEQLDALLDFLEDNDLHSVILKEDNGLVLLFQCRNSEEESNFLYVNSGVYYVMNVDGRLDIVESYTLFENGFSLN